MTTETTETRTRDLPDKALTPDQLYQRNYHRDNRERRAKKRADRRKKDKAFREQDIQRLRDRRAQRRQEVATQKFDQLVEAKREKLQITRRPRYAEIDGERVFVFGTGSLAREVGREDATIRAWLTQGVLPGASVWVGRRAQFTKAYCEAVRQACRKLLLEDGRGDLDILKRIIREEFRDKKITFVRKNGRKRFTA
jgi:hypothetical protein